MNLRAFAGKKLCQEYWRLSIVQGSAVTSLVAVLFMAPLHQPVA